MRVTIIPALDTVVTYVTHDGMFHLDELFAVSLLQLCLAEGTVTRSRQLVVSQNATIYVDVGSKDESILVSPAGLKPGVSMTIDHHQKDDVTACAFERCYNYLVYWEILRPSVAMGHLTELISNGDIRPMGNVLPMYLLLRDVICSGSFEEGLAIAKRVLRKYLTQINDGFVGYRNWNIKTSAAVVHYHIGSYSSETWYHDERYDEPRVDVEIPYWQSEGLVVLIKNHGLLVDNHLRSTIGDEIWENLPETVVGQLEKDATIFPYGFKWNLLRKKESIGPETTVVGRQFEINEWLSRLKHFTIENVQCDVIRR